MYCPGCRTAIPDDSDTCPECDVEIGSFGVQMQSRRRTTESPPLLSFRSIGGFITGLLAMGIMVFVVCVSVGAVPCVVGKSAAVLSVCQWAENLLSDARQPLLRSVPRGVRWFLLPVFYVVAMVAAARTLDVLESVPTIRSSAGLGRLLVGGTALCLGLFALRTRLFLFNSLGRFVDWGLNGAVFGVGLAVAFAMVYTRSDD